MDKIRTNGEDADVAQLASHVLAAIRHLNVVLVSLDGAPDADPEFFGPVRALQSSAAESVSYAQGCQRRLEELLVAQRKPVGGEPHARPEGEVSPAGDHPQFAVCAHCGKEIYRFPDPAAEADYGLDAVYEDTEGQLVCERWGTPHRPAGTPARSIPAAFWGNPGVCATVVATGS